MSEPRITCTRCGTDLGPATLRAVRDPDGRTGWRWDRTPATPRTCPGNPAQEATTHE